MSIFMNFKSIIFTCILFVVLSFVGCKKLLEVDDPLNELPSEIIFKSETTAKSALAGAYATMSSMTAFNTEFTLLNALSADEMAFVGGAELQDFTQNTYDPILTKRLDGLWSDIYNVIYRFNNVIEGLQNNTAIAAPVARQIVGEAKVMRAYCYFHLINLFGDVPLVKVTDVNINNTLPRLSAQEIYKWMVDELEESKTLVADEYVVNSGTSGRGQVNRSAARALLARVYLHLGKYDLAKENATAIISKSDLYSLLAKDELDKVFLKDSREAILQLGPAVLHTTGYTVEGSTFVPSSYATVADYELSPSLLTAFEAGDKRRVSWTYESNFGGKQTFQPYKYQNYSPAEFMGNNRIEVPMIFRLAEQYLIRAEARFRTNDRAGALEDLQMIRSRAGLNPLPATVDLEKAILHERQVEFFAELGDRWYTMKRMGKADAILKALKPLSWRTTAQLYPIPQSARDTNPFLTQNEGYR